MAYIEKRRDDQQQQGQQLVQPGQMQETALGSGPSGAPEGGPAPGAASPQPAAANAPVGRFAGIQGFLNANRAQGQQMAQGLQQKVGGDLQGAKKGLDQSAAAWSANSFQQGKQAYGDWKKSQDTQATQLWNQYLGRNHTQKDIDAYNQRMAQVKSQTFQMPQFAQYSPDVSAAQKAQGEYGALGSDAGVATMLGAPQGLGGALDVTLVNQASPNLQGQVKSKYGGVLDALKKPTTPNAPTQYDFMSPDAAKAARAAARRWR